MAAFRESVGYFGLLTDNHSLAEELLAAGKPAPRWSRNTRQAVLLEEGAKIEVYSSSVVSGDRVGIFSAWPGTYETIGPIAAAVSGIGLTEALTSLVQLGEQNQDQRTEVGGLLVEI